jgi:hypothetical protein
MQIPAKLMSNLWEEAFKKRKFVFSLGKKNISIHICCIRRPTCMLSSNCHPLMPAGNRTDGSPG